MSEERGTSPKQKFDNYKQTHWKQLTFCCLALLDFISNLEIAQVVYGVVSFQRFKISSPKL
jgi:hypothetical protein